MKWRREYKFESDLAAADFTKELDKKKFWLRALHGDTVVVILDSTEDVPPMRATEANQLAEDCKGVPIEEWNTKGG
jgi:hypothetical protein